MAAKGLLAIPENARVSTRDLLSSHLACLSLHVMNAELLEAKQSNHLDNDFERCEIAKGPGGQKLVIHNSRFQTRVRHSMQVRTTRLCLPD